ncbi:MAG: DEAD/DEAH box helicase family protein [Candidatus Dojkabacteria bacterium]
MKVTVYTTRQVVEFLEASKDELRKFKNRFGCYGEVEKYYLYHLFESIGGGKYIVPRYYPFFSGSLYPDISIEYAKENETDLPKVAFPIKPGVKFRSDNQRSAFQFLEVSTNKGSRSLMLNLRTGTGKTFLAIRYASFLNHKVLIVTDKIDLLKQWSKEFQNFTEIENKEIKTLKGVSGLTDVIETPEKYQNVKVFLTTSQTLSAAILNYDFNILKEFQAKMGIGLKIIDEAHKEIKSIFTIDAYNNIPYNLYLTATPARSDRGSDKLLHYILPFKDSFGLELETKAYHKVLLVDYKTYPTKEIINTIEQSKYGFNVVKYSSYIGEEGWKCFSYMLEELLTQLYSKKFRKTFIIFKTLDILEKTSELIKQIFDDKYSVGKFTGKVAKNDRAEQLDNDIVLCTEKIFQTGIDVPDLQILINTFPMSSKVLTEQIIGRLRGNQLNSLYVDITDSSFNKTINQLNHRKQVFKKFAKEIYSMSIDTGEAR